MDYNIVKEQFDLGNNFKDSISNLVKEHCGQISTYFGKKYAKDDLLSEGLTIILDDIFENIVKVCPEKFMLTLDDIRFKHLIRGRRKEWHCKNDLCSPSIEIAKSNNIINRWNPPDKRYLYLVVGKGISDDIETAYEELRIKPGEMITLSNFEVRTTAKNAMILDLDYENISRNDIFNYVEEIERKQVNRIVTNIIESGVLPTEDYVKQQVIIEASNTKWLANAFAGKLLLKEICDAIFIPLDKTDDNDNAEKEKCYKSFHILATYFENKGCAGICYPSTRMKLIGKQGSNLVLFDADSAEPILNTFQHICK